MKLIAMILGFVRVIVVKSGISLTKQYQSMQKEVSKDDYVEFSELFEYKKVKICLERLEKSDHGFYV